MANEELYMRGKETHKHTTYIVLHYALSSAVLADREALSPTSAFSQQLPLYKNTQTHTPDMQLRWLLFVGLKCHQPGQIAISVSYTVPICAYKHVNPAGTLMFQWQLQIRLLCMNHACVVPSYTWHLWTVVFLQVPQQHGSETNTV